MRRAILLALSVLPLLAGCHALVRNAEVIDYRPGATASATVAKYDAEYSLSAPAALRGWIGTDVRQGQTVGFCQDADGSVTAFAGEQRWPIDPSDGRHVWLCTPKPETAWDRFIVGTRDKCEKAAMLVFLGPALVVNGCITGEWP